MKVCIPPIKSQGIKTKLVPWISSVVPPDFKGTWVEPFMGTGVVAFNVAPARALLCDTNPHLINFYSSIANGEIDAAIAKKYLNHEGALLLKKGEDHYYFVRDRFNKTKDPLDFLFLNRSGFNGMIRFNRKGELNIPFCRKPNRFAQAYVTKIVNQIDALSKLLKSKSFTFKCQGFEETIKSASSGDIIYCDPPYIDRHVDFFNSWTAFDEQKLFEDLLDFEGKFILSTWHSNAFRSNEYIESLWNNFSVLTKEHFYHVGGRESNRNSVLEALVVNYSTEREHKEFSGAISRTKNKQINLFAAAE